MIRVTDQLALQQSAVLDELAAQGRSGGLLHGLIFTVKDVIDLAGTPTTNGANFPCEQAMDDAEVVARIKRHGATIIGKNNLHEFAYGGTTQNPFWGSCRNPWNVDRIPGGSSGGSGAAVAAGYCDVSLGTDTAGSGRLPAALNGISALRPTLGRISNRGVTPCSFAFDTISPMARRVSDIVATYSVIAGYDKNDPISANRPVAPLVEGRRPSISGMRIGIPSNPIFNQLDPGIAKAFYDAVNMLKALGAHCVPVEIPDFELAGSTLERLFHSDAAAYHSQRLVTSPERFGPDIRERLLTLGGKFTAIEYSAALQWMMEWRRSLEAVFETIDAIAHPTTPTVAPLVETCKGTTAMTRRLAALCYPWSLAGAPSLSVPMGFAEFGMPCGLTFVTPWWEENTALKLGLAYQDSTAWHLRSPFLI